MRNKDVERVWDTQPRFFFLIFALKAPTDERRPSVNVADALATHGRKRVFFLNFASMRGRSRPLFPVEVEYHVHVFSCLLYGLFFIDFAR
jgi:hypothetical protein